MKILFICTGNTCRSPMAAEYFRHLVNELKRDDIEVASAGTFAGEGVPAAFSSIKVMKTFGVDLSSHRSSQLTLEKIESSDLIVAMTQSHRIQVGALCPKALAKTKLLLDFADRKGEDIADPIGGDDTVYSLSFQEMKPALENLLLEYVK